MRSVGSLHSRKHARLPPVSYRSGTFFVTICTHDRRCHLGRVVEDAVELLTAGRIVDEEWRRLVDGGIVRDSIWVVMPDHFHAMFTLNSRSPESAARSTAGGPPMRSLGALVGLFKSRVTARARRELGLRDFWQRGYHDHVVRSEEERLATTQYIMDNPRHWSQDRENPQSPRPSRQAGTQEGIRQVRDTK